MAALGPLPGDDRNSPEGDSHSDSADAQAAEREPDGFAADDPDEAFAPRHFQTARYSSLLPEWPHRVGIPSAAYS